MNVPAVAQYALFLIIVFALVTPVGAYLGRVFTGERTFLDRTLVPIERAIHRLGGIDPAHRMSWTQYARAFVLFGAAGTLLLYGLLRVQSTWYDAAHLNTPMTPDLALNTAISFATTTTWQAYAGESTMSYSLQLIGLAAQNFLAGAAGLAVGIAFIRGIAAEGEGLLGNFWVDVVRSLLWVLLPLSLVGGLVLIAAGVPMTFEPSLLVRGLEGGAQTIARGPVAALEMIKQLGTNGGGFFNANGAHPFENPTPLTNFIELLGIAVLPASLTYTFGRMTGRQRDGWLIFGVMTLFTAGGLAATHAAESAQSPALASVALAPGGNMEGKETRFGVGASALAAVITSNGATGSYNAMHDSFNPLGGAVPLVNMLLGEINYGGLGTGLISMLMIALLGLFVTGLMVGRSPSYCGKALGPRELQFIALYTVIAPVVILSLTAITVVAAPGRAGLTTNQGAHGFTEILFAYASAFANNGQNFAGLSANTPFYNNMTAIAMMLGRFGLAIPALALAGSFAAARRREGAEVGTVPTSSLLFGGVMVSTAIIVGALSFFPALALGPIVEHLSMR
jgi:potassium-transporting ATPase potassium-binding subunit